MHGFPQLPALFEQLCDAPEEDREHILQGVEDPALRDRLRVLLEADRVASRVIGTRADASGSSVLARDLAAETHPEHIGPFRILQRLGAGAMGVVYEAEQDHPLRRVALKRLHPWLQSDVALELFRFEAQALGQVNHPSIPVVYEAGEADGAAYLTMERVYGQPLLTWVHQSHASLEDRVRLLVAIARAVFAAHQAELVHRDLKPENILVTEEGFPTLLDFGVAAPFLSRQSGAQPGTPVYMSPEQARGEAVGSASDVHALGTVAYQLLTGTLPVTGGHLKKIAFAKEVLPPRADTLEPGLDVDVARVIERAMQPDPAQRPTAAAFADDLERALRAEPLPWVPQHPRYLLGRFLRRNRRALRLAAAGAAVVALGVLGVLAAQSYTESLRVKTAEGRKDRMIARGDRSIAAGEFDIAARALTEFVEDPSHAWTPARVDAWLWWAERQQREDRDRGLHALAEAWLAAGDSDSLDRVGLALARRFQMDGSWSELWRLREVLSAETRLEAAVPLRQAAIARRDFDAALELGPADAGLLKELSRARPTNQELERAVWLDVDGDGTVEMITLGVGDVQIHDVTGTQRLATHQLRGAVGWINHRHFFEREGELWMGSEAFGGSLQSFRLTPTGLQLTHRLQGLGVGRLISIDLLETAEGPLILRAMGYPHRALSWVDPEVGAIPSRHPPTDAMHSDVMAVEVVDLDGDGVTEIVVGLGAWNADEVRILRRVGDGFEVASRLPTGTMQDIVLVPREGQPPLLLVNKGNLEMNRRIYPEDQPFGPAPGFYLLEWDGQTLHQVDFLPLPIADGPGSGPERTAFMPFVGDFDGDGTLDVASTLQYFDIGVHYLGWIVLDVLGEPRDIVLGAVGIKGSTDVDGDGDDELLVTNGDGFLWILGTGEERLQVWDKPVLTTTLPPPPSNDPLVIRGWQRAQQLVSIGMPAEATAALSVLPGLAEHPDASLAANLAAARLLEAAGDPEGAAEHFATVFEARPEDSEVKAGLVRSRVAALDLKGASTAAAGLEDPSVQWLDQVVPRVTLLDVDTVADWKLHVAGALRRTQGMLEVEAYNDHGVLASRRVRVEGPVLGLELRARIEALELGAGLSVELVGGPSQQEIMVAFWGQGGGGTVKLYQHCAGKNMRDIGRPSLQPSTELQLTVLRSNVDGKLHCVNKVDGVVARWNFLNPEFEPGEYTLRLRVHGVSDYHPPNRVLAVLHAIEGIGITPIPTPSTPEQDARLAMFRGHAAPGLPVEEAAWAALASGDASGLDHALEERWKAGDRRRLRWLIRSHGSDVVAPLTTITGKGFSKLFMESWREVIGSVDPMPAFDLELLRPPLASLPADDPAGARLRIVRAQIRLAHGERGRARTLVDSVLDANEDPTLRIDAWLLWARITEVESQARQAVARAIALDDSGRTADRVRRSATLRPWMPDE